MQLDATDRCDRCGAQAYVRTEHPVDDHTVTLDWCGHHAHEHHHLLAGHITVDERDLLTSSRPGLH